MPATAAAIPARRRWFFFAFKGFYAIMPCKGVISCRSYGSRALRGRVLRVLGDSPCPAVPETVEGLPVTEIGPYCFADKPVKAGARRSGTDTHEITGNFCGGGHPARHGAHPAQRSVYNCRRLRRLSLGAGVEGLGSDLFTNCRSLARLCLRAAPDAPHRPEKAAEPSAPTLPPNLTAHGCFTPEYSGIS